MLTTSETRSNSDGTDYSGAIKNILLYLNDNYSDYTWYQGKICSTKMISNEIPINVQRCLFPKDDVQQAIANTGIRSSYGGCGPIAMLGILDYFARYLGYDEIIDDLTSSIQRVRLAEDVFNTVTTYEIGDLGNKNTLTLP